MPKETYLEIPYKKSGEGKVKIPLWYLEKKIQEIVADILEKMWKDVMPSEPFPLAEEE